MYPHVATEAIDRSPGVADLLGGSKAKTSSIMSPQIHIDQVDAGKTEIPIADAEGSI